MIKLTGFVLFGNTDHIPGLDVLGSTFREFDNPVGLPHPDTEPRAKRLDVNNLLALQPEHVDRHTDEQHVDEPPCNGVVPAEGEFRLQPRGWVKLEDQRVVVGDRRAEHQALRGLDESFGDVDIAGEDGLAVGCLVDDTHGRAITESGQNTVGGGSATVGFEALILEPLIRTAVTIYRSDRTRASPGGHDRGLKRACSSGVRSIWNRLTAVRITRSSMLIGAHTSIAGGVYHAVDEQVEYDGNCGQIFSHSPQVWQDPNIGDDEAEKFRERSDEEDVGPWVIHSSYLVNLCTPKDDLREKSIDSMQKEVDAAAKLDIEYVNVHLGAHTGAGVEGGLTNAASALDELDIPESVTVLIESDAGSGTKLGGDFEHLAGVLDRSEQDLEICLDTAHMFAAGYDISTAEGVDETVAEFDEVVGLDKLACIHLNDSKHECGTNKDEHAHVGEGLIGEAGMQAVINHEGLRECPYVLETPSEDGKSFAWNVERVRELRE